MRIGIDGRKIPEADKRGPLATVDHAREIGMDGVFFRTVLEMSPTLDLGALRDIKARADDLNMYLETGLGKVNPYANPETPELREIGDGDIVLGFRRMMEACAEIDCRELWVATANYKSAYEGRFAYDRFRTDVDWIEQLRATAGFLRRLAPIARDLGIHMNLETHEEITSFELVRLVEDVGADTVGIVFDTANVLQRVEHPVWTARRVAPYVRQSHMKDCSVVFADKGLRFQLRPCGTGVVGFDEILPILAAANPDLHLTIENAQSHIDKPNVIPPRLIDVWNPDFLAGHPDLTVEELAAYLHMVHEYADRCERESIPDQTTYAAMPFGYDETVRYIIDSADHLRSICRLSQLPMEEVNAR
jgi:sugar phosphate isomerase/epimerase